MLENFDFSFVPKKFSLMTILTSAYHSLRFEKIFLCLFFRRSDFYMNIRICHAFFEFWGRGLGGEAPQKIFGDSQAIFQHFRICEIIFAFLRESGGEARKSFEIFHFFDAGGATENFS